VDVAGRSHALVVYKASARADDALRRLCLTAEEEGSRLTVVALADEEHPARGCCDTRSTLWNRLCRDMALEDLMRAAQVAGGRAGINFDVVVAPSRSAAEKLASEALARGADRIVLADARRSGLGRLALRRLRRRSPVPVGA
jgi:hypothetical protein